MFENITRTIICAAGLVFLGKAYREEMQNPESRKIVDDAKAKVKDVLGITDSKCAS